MDYYELNMEVLEEDTKIYETFRRFQQNNSNYNVTPNKITDNKNGKLVCMGPKWINKIEFSGEINTSQGVYEHNRVCLSEEKRQLKESKEYRVSNKTNSTKNKRNNNSQNLKVINRKNEKNNSCLNLIYSPLSIVSSVSDEDDNDNGVCNFFNDNNNEMFFDADDDAKDVNNDEVFKQNGYLKESERRIDEKQNGWTNKNTNNSRNKSSYQKMNEGTDERQSSRLNEESFSSSSFLAASYHLPSINDLPSHTPETTIKSSVDFNRQLTRIDSNFDNNIADEGFNYNDEDECEKLEIETYESSFRNETQISMNEHSKRDFNSNYNNLNLFNNDIYYCVQKKNISITPNSTSKQTFINDNTNVFCNNHNNTADYNHNNNKNSNMNYLKGKYKNSQNNNINNIIKNNNQNRYTQSFDEVKEEDTFLEANETENRIKLINENKNVLIMKNINKRKKIFKQPTPVSNQSKAHNGVQNNKNVNCSKKDEEMHEKITENMNNFNNNINNHFQQRNNSSNKVSECASLNEGNENDYECLSDSKRGEVGRSDGGGWSNYLCQPKKYITDEMKCFKSKENVADFNKNQDTNKSPRMATNKIALKSKNVHLKTVKIAKKNRKIKKNVNFKSENGRSNDDDNDDDEVLYDEEDEPMFSQETISSMNSLLKSFKLSKCDGDVNNDVNNGQIDFKKINKFEQNDRITQKSHEINSQNTRCNKINTHISNSCHSKLHHTSSEISIDSLTVSGCRDNDDDKFGCGLDIYDDGVNKGNEMSYDEVHDFKNKDCEGNNKNEDGEGYDDASYNSDENDDDEDDDVSLNLTSCECTCYYSTDYETLPCREHKRSGWVGGESVVNRMIRENECLGVLKNVEKTRGLNKVRNGEINIKEREGCKKLLSDIGSSEGRVDKGLEMLKEFSNVRCYQDTKEKYKVMKNKNGNFLNNKQRNSNNIDILKERAAKNPKKSLNNGKLKQNTELKVIKNLQIQAYIQKNKNILRAQREFVLNIPQRLGNDARNGPNNGHSKHTNDTEFSMMDGNNDKMNNEKNDDEICAKKFYEEGSLKAGISYLAEVSLKEDENCDDEDTFEDIGVNNYLINNQNKNIINNKNNNNISNNKNNNNIINNNNKIKNINNKTNIKNIYNYSYTNNQKANIYVDNNMDDKEDDSLTIDSSNMGSYDEAYSRSLCHMVRKFEPDDSSKNGKNITNEGSGENDQVENSYGLNNKKITCKSNTTNNEVDKLKSSIYGRDNVRNSNKNNEICNINEVECTEKERDERENREDLELKNSSKLDPLNKSSFIMARNKFEEWTNRVNEPKDENLDRFKPIFVNNAKERKNGLFNIGSNGRVKGVDDVGKMQDLTRFGNGNGLNEDDGRVGGLWVGESFENAHCWSTLSTVRSEDLPSPV